LLIADFQHFTPYLRIPPPVNPFITNLLPAGAYISIEVEPVNANEQLPDATEKEKRMNANFNWLMDNVAIRVTLNTVAFALWMAASVGLLAAAVKL
jgi:hypothetical protein